MRTKGHPLTKQRFPCIPNFFFKKNHLNKKYSIEFDLLNYYRGLGDWVVGKFTKQPMGSNKQADLYPVDSK